MLTRGGKDIPLSKITEVTFRQNITDRMFSCGTLVMSSASEIPLQFDDIPHVQDVHTLIYHAINDDSEGAGR